MKPSKLAEAITICVSARQPAFIWGAPGIGKSDVMRQTAAKLQRSLIDVRAVLLDPVDLRGLPHVNGDGRAHWAIPEFLPRDGAGILFLDELNAAPQLVQAACYQLVLDCKLGEYTLPAEWVVMAAGNRESDGAVTHRMPSALRSRFEHLDAEADLDDWCKWACASGIEPAVIAFLRFRPDLLHKFERQDRCFPCPRTWEFVSRITAQPANQDVQHALFCGAVGEGAAIEYSAFLRLYKTLPSLDAILLNPSQANVPTDPATLYAVSSALARKASDSNIGRAIQYLDRLPQEYGVMAVKDAVTRDASLATTREFTTWAVNHSEVTF